MVFASYAIQCVCLPSCWYNDKLEKLSLENRCLCVCGKMIVYHHEEEMVSGWKLSLVIAHLLPKLYYLWCFIFILNNL